MNAIRREIIGTVKPHCNRLLYPKMSPQGLVYIYKSVQIDGIQQKR